MTDHDAGDPVVTQALRRLPTPEHRAEFWGDFEQRLASEPVLPEGGGVAVAVESSTRGDGGATGVHPIAELRRASEDPPGRWGRLIAAAAAVLVIATSIATAFVADRDEPVDVAVRPGSPTTSPTSVTEDVGPAERAALDWLDVLAAGDMQTAWDRLGPAAKDVWPSFEAFASSRSAFAEGMALWASAEDRQVGTARVEGSGAASLFVVTITGTRRPEGTEEHGALVVIVREEPKDRFLVEPFSPTSAGLRFTSPVPGPQPATLGANEPIALESPGGEGRLLLVLGRDGEPVEATPDASGRATYLPAGGWTSGRQVVTAALVGPSGQAITAAIVFDVP